MAVAAVQLGWLVGCARGSAALGISRSIQESARPLLELDPDANWTACYNRLIDAGPRVIDQLVHDPVMQTPAGADDLEVALRSSLVRILAPPDGAPRLSLICYETAYDLLHLAPKIYGRSPGEPRMVTGARPADWRGLYLDEFNLSLAVHVDVDADRRAILAWWEQRRDDPQRWITRRKLSPRGEQVLALLSRRRADVWTYQPGDEALILCSTSAGAARRPWLAPQRRFLLNEEPPGSWSVAAYDYNVVRAACIWLGQSDDLALRGRLIEAVGSESPVESYNARFALGFCPDPRIRAIVERYNERPSAAPEEPPAAREDALPL